VFTDNNQQVSKGMWLAGPDLENFPDATLLRRIFKEVDPGLANTLYLILHWNALSYLSKEQRMCCGDMKCSRFKLLSRQDAVDYEEVRRLIVYLWYEVREELNPEEILSREKKFDAKLEELGWSPRTGLRVRLRHVADNLRRLREKGALAILHDLETVAYYLKDGESTPNGVWFELFRERKPDYAALKDLVLHHTNDLLETLPEQPLLRSRVLQTTSAIQQTHDEKIATYAAALDRMRRTRNALMHNGGVPEEMPLLARTLYYYSKAYLKDVICELTARDHTPNSLKSILFID
jgi:hypothetical protein